MFSGVYTAIVTPFTTGGAVDTDALDRLVDAQIAGGVQGLVPVGTTGESPTLSNEEHIDVIRRVQKRADGKVQIIAGTGANSTREACELTRAALDLGCDATLQVTPYYNKPSDDGLLAHFMAVADLGLPVVLYNVPGRAGKELSIDLIGRCAAHPSVVSVKEAGGSVDRVSQILAMQPDICVLSGDDPLTLPMISVGARGVISVASNAFPERVVAMVSAALAGQFAEARKLHLQNHGLFSALLGMEVNPLPIKTALAMMGAMEEKFRLPLCPMTEENRALLEELLNNEGVLS
ncbi:4-hydroxy-tetrahydrodipicolinate synthase [Kiritimatiellaeota bacterium B1221]|nr:4-hydroxy-tetrahydrodipicolinate synthase [Kiritimatiellaeota bacterium B1221]